MRTLTIITILSCPMFFFGCGSNADFIDPEVGSTWYVSVRELPVAGSPDAFAEPTARLAYGTPVVIKQLVQVTPLGTEPRDDIPKWVLVHHTEGAGYVPVASLASEWLMERQDTRSTLESSDSSAVAMRGFSDEEDADLTAMKGAVGSAQYGRPDYNRLAGVMAGPRTEDLATFAAKGGIATSGLAARRHIVEDDGPGFFSKVWGGMRKGAAWTANQVSGDEGGENRGRGRGHGRQKGRSDDSEISQAIYDEVGPFQEYQIGRAVSARLLGRYRIADPNSPAAIYVRKVGSLVAMGSSSPHPYDGYRFVLLEAKDVNAFAAPGGFVFITTGMLNFLKTEDELAAILGHEVGHLELRHGVRAVKRGKLMDMFGDLARRADGSIGSGHLDDIMVKMMGKITQGYSREIESEADERSIEISAMLGYDTTALHGILERFRDASGSYGGANYPRERGSDALEVQRRVDPRRANRTLEVRTRRYNTVVRNRQSLPEPESKPKPKPKPKPRVRYHVPE